MESYAQTTRVLKALSDPKRLEIVDRLMEREYCAYELLPLFEVTQPTLSHDMKVLSEVGVIKQQRKGKNVVYSVNREVLEDVVHHLNVIISK
ncbi:MAG: metalloregulator ArsR/SmtB family transcription factor [Absicoccus sp.]|uniref:Metalloregulator ArsR/SmtB family transcription factor n=1 Tax=Absicoccus intestinalis TaxID=2926319 RepID=A0ABU4WIJ8_9FIRM|nr:MULTISPECIES: metalloregulator ArsR/SmtB family transcription factor [unclassified Absicoccus]MDX8416391.1 metalloregulator ArsR/SmtB family transcription factor [Absicoccus sp. CLA-KB-P134]MDY3035758.1 metalloregulator ArsR/SmtB family transcription factor [Absicoccus sp.]